MPVRVAIIVFLGLFIACWASSWLAYAPSGLASRKPGWDMYQQIASTVCLYGLTMYLVWKGTRDI